MRNRPSLAAIPAFAAAAALALLLGACAGEAPAAQPASNSESTTAPDSTTEPLPTASAPGEDGDPVEPDPNLAADEHEPIPAPKAVFGMTCNQLMPSSEMTTLTGPGVHPTRPDSLPNSALDTGISVQYAFRQLQGYSCLWTNDETAQFDTGGILIDNPAYVELKINVIPNATKDYAKANSMFGPYSATKPWLCNTDRSRDYRYCRWTGLASSKHWIEVSMQGLKLQGSESATVAQFMALKNGVVSRLESATLADPWAVPADVRTISNACPGLITAEVVAQAFESQPDQVRFQDAGQGDPYIEAVGPQLAKTDSCHFSVPGQERSYGPSVAELAGGEWAWQEARAAGKGSFTSIAPLTLEGLNGGNSAWIRTTKRGSSVDLLIDGNWVSLHVDDYTMQPLALSTRTAIIALAQGVVDLTRN